MNQWLPDRVVAAEREVDDTFDVSACVREPIHKLGGVQSYGALIGVRDGKIVVASENAGTVLGVPEPRGAVTRLLTDWQMATLAALADADTGQTAMMPVELGGVGSGRRFDVTVHRADGLLVLEFEPASPAGEFASAYAPVRQALVRLQRAGTVAEACQEAVREIRAITGYDRVVAYRFESADGPGEVIAEEVAAGWEPWLGLWFPATDIPPQARRLYEHNWIRVIADVEDETARLVPEVLPDTGEPLDLSMSVLRTVSDFHLEYLRNIEVTSSMSVSLLSGGRLWGLIACHGRARKELSPPVRSACEFFGVALSLQLASLREHDVTSARERSRQVIAGLLADEPLQPAGLKDLMDCDAVLVRTNGDLTVHGDGLGPEAAAALLAALPDTVAGEIWSSECLADDLADMPEKGPAGVLALRSGAEGDVVVWVRAERTVARRWATDPSRPITMGPHGRRLTPRGSTAVFLASVRGHSMPWSTTDLVMAAELGRAMMASALANARRLSALNAELTRSNVDLDSFAHAAAHDLKEPLRGIANTATFIVEDAEGMDDVTTRRLASIQRLAERMDELLNALLYYSRLGRTEVQSETVGLRDAALRALEVAGPRLREADVEVILPDQGATVHADPMMFDQVLINLLVNAAKYAQPEQPRRVEIGVDDGFFVRDNGIGMPAHLREQAFQLFRRLHPPTGPKDGSGAGLAIVRRIVERHGGQVWAEESPGGGTTVRATFPEGRDPQ
ncbi:light-regulated signal transduction histidine kinase (bacteriophytochrome) [Actinoplanes lutulentus]|uniref:Sensor-like histidine kinase SenX3 n=1 Tax=Actinoplanes lutulentus TaxID=1287878 RepID=A0A327ZL90_9ACTN|nr:ATP-binding protein [Actinoplanes lutulentus]MBB2940750.1 light-regulated signal transduction histidine kinase (bacteriophytochrome) [Actinoplanes lutulentus]RAK43061.1 light-regulated signal transduction histidine kinase (bacteriophytochrome) [Actinoplanes lutulentus]